MKLESLEVVAKALVKGQRIAGENGADHSSVAEALRLVNEEIVLAKKAAKESKKDK